ncbi:MAG TPA: iron-sulfur cluster carrier protein ApbC [Acetobacteraceae bacterium]|nr:iron-sulfur cluster carrier protein ApbC [Acetobacteraceae bacterium]
MVAKLDEAAIRARLAEVSAQGERITPPMIDSIAVRDGLVHVALAIPRERAAALEPLRREAEAALGRIPGVTNASVVFTAHRQPAQAAPQAPPQPSQMMLSNVKSVIAVASGKGGVGKSTVAVNLAAALAKRGLRTGLLDADIYGPSLPRMLGVSRKPQMSGNMLMPIEAWGLLAMSIGFVVAEETAMVWRGPMVMNALQQLMTQVAWPELDAMVIDMPPGTGDVQLTLAQRTRLAGAVVVSTPQDIALIDARRGVSMFQQVRVPVLGIVENMSFFCCPNCNHRTDIFGHGGARAEAGRIGVPFLGEVPLLPAIRETSDAGTPITVSAPESEAARAFAAVAEKVAQAVAGPVRAGPRISIE